MCLSLYDSKLYKHSELHCVHVHIHVYVYMYRLYMYMYTVHFMYMYYVIYNDYILRHEFKRMCLLRNQQKNYMSMYALKYWMHVTCLKVLIGNTHVHRWACPGRSHLHY